MKEVKILILKSRVKFINKFMFAALVLIYRYKAWGSLLGMQLAERDIIVACLDYR